MGTPVSLFDLIISVAFSLTLAGAAAHVFCVHVMCFAHHEISAGVDFACHSALYFVQLPLRYDTCKSIRTVCNTIFTLCPPEQTLQTH